MNRLRIDRVAPPATSPGSSPDAHRATRALRLAQLRLRATEALWALHTVLAHDTAGEHEDDALQTIEAALATLDEWAETDPRGG